MNEADEDGITPLHVACKGGREQIVTLLIKYGVSVNTGDRNGITPLHLACEDGNKAIVKLLLDSFANVNMGDNEGTTALHIACKNGDHNIVKCLLAAGAYVNKYNKNGVTPLLIAFNSGSEETFNADSNLSVKGVADSFAMVQSTRKGGREDIVRLLLNAGANVNPDEKGAIIQIEKKSILDNFFRKS
ncbi:integrin-linked protein kinase-like [Mytilus trossulus]|uniref:integrin-linked protein kinase-like n=1 Tax=Mytilus trossulus TaxID=6551 RepID=UPI0030048B75